ncbi:MAG: hypothetical protein FWE84_03920 [Firmicutes bacterium]|nr:hypothetical protein [Bacillota bacterium]
MENNWTIQQTKNLFGYVKKAADSGKGLKWAFERASTESGRSVNSVRNYYYSQLKMFELVPGLARDLKIETIKSRRNGFELFSEDEITALIRTILKEKAKGRSVRAIITSIAGGPKQALRLQNKYRSMVAHNRSRVMAIMNSMSEKGEAYYNPYQKQVVDGGRQNDNLLRLNEYISKLDAGEVGSFLNILGKLKL